MGAQSWNALQWLDLKIGYQVSSPAIAISVIFPIVTKEKIFITSPCICLNCLQAMTPECIVLLQWKLPHIDNFIITGTDTQESMHTINESVWRYQSRLPSNVYWHKITAGNPWICRRLSILIMYIGFLLSAHIQIFPAGSMNMSGHINLYWRPNVTHRNRISVEKESINLYWSLNFPYCNRISVQNNSEKANQ